MPGSPSRFSGDEAAEHGDHDDHLAEGGRLRRGRLSGLEDDDGLPLIVVEDGGAGHVGDGASEPGEMLDAPGDDHVDGEAGFEAVGGAELSFLDLAAALEGAVEDLDVPSAGIPSQAFEGLVEGLDGAVGEQHPFERL